MKSHDAYQGEARGILPECERLCAATGKVRPIAAMIRFVIGPDQMVVPDVKRRLPGRGVWITANRQALELAVRRGSFERSFKCQVSVSADIVDLTERLLQAAALDALSMARKAGKVAIGFAKSEAALSREHVVALVHAAGAAHEGFRKLSAARNRRDDCGAIAVLDEFTTAQLDLALGRSNVVHAALLAGAESERLLARVARLHSFRNAPPPATPAAGNSGSNRPARCAPAHECPGHEIECVS